MDKSARSRRIKGLGEGSIRVRDLDAMRKFYEEVVGLEVAAHRGLCQAGREFCFLQSRRGLWRSYPESRPL
jgi:catechol 2,3-dioxygenase-like lactoylglutathione lyase family enzyme